MISYQVAGRSRPSRGQAGDLNLSDQRGFDSMLLEGRGVEGSQGKPEVPDSANKIFNCFEKLSLPGRGDTHLWWFQ